MKLISTLLVTGAVLIVLFKHGEAQDEQLCKFRNYCPDNSTCKSTICGNYECLIVERVGDDVCHPNPCNGGTCELDDMGGYACTCKDARYSGTNCRHVRPFVEVIAEAYEEAMIGNHISDNFEYVYGGGDVSSNNERHSIIFDHPPYMTHHLAAVSDVTYVHENAQLLKKTTQPLYALHYVTSDNARPLALKSISKASIQNEMRLEGTLTDGDHTMHYLVLQSKDDDEISNPYYGRIFFVVRKQSNTSVLLDEVEMSQGPSHTVFMSSISNQEVGDVFGFTLLASQNNSGSKPLTTSDVTNAMMALLGKHVATVEAFAPIDVYPRKSTVEIIAEKISSGGGALVDSISDFYEYNKDETNIALTSDLSGDIYSTGNYIAVGAVPGLVHYGQIYSHKNFEFTSIFDDAFMGLMWISNEDQSQQNFTYNVQSFIPQFGSGSNGQGQGKFFMSRHRISFKFIQAYNGGNGEHSVCEVYFTMQSAKRWGSDIEAGDFDVIAKAESTYGFANEVFITGSPRRILTGYIILAKTSSDMFTRKEVQMALKAKLEPLTKNNGICVNTK